MLLPDMVDDPQIDMAALFKALGDPIRLQVVELLRDRERCVCDLSQQLDIAQSKLSFHLKTLKSAEVVRSRQEGRWIYYRLNVAKLVELEQYLAEFRRFAVFVSAPPC